MSAPDISQLSTSQQEALQTYTAVTDQEPIAAIGLLQRCEWNVQIAIARFFDGEPATDPPVPAEASLPARDPRRTANLHYESLLASTRQSVPLPHADDVVERVDTSSATETQYRPGLFLSSILVPVQLLFRVLRAALYPLTFLAPSFFARLFRRLVDNRSSFARRALPPAENARRFIREFGEDYGAGRLPFSESGFNLTLDTAKRDFKFLLVVLLSPSHDDNAVWVQETLLSSQVRQFVDAHAPELVLWGGNVRDAEPYQVATSLQCTKFPFAALICQSSDAGSPEMTVVLRAVGTLSASELVAKLGAAMTAHQSQLTAARAQRAEQQASRTLRQEQDSAYERSLAQDRERTRRRREEEEAAAQAAREALERAQAQARRRENMMQWRRWRAQSLPPEPAADDRDALRISIRLPSGERVVRRFRADADLEELYAFVECYDVVQGEDSERERPDHVRVPEPAGYEHEYSFRLVSPMPRNVFELGKGGSVGHTIGRGANLIAEPMAADDDDSDQA